MSDLFNQHYCATFLMTMKQLSHDFCKAIRILLSNFTFLGYFKMQAIIWPWKTAIKRRWLLFLPWFKIPKLSLNMTSHIHIRDFIKLSFTGRKFCRKFESIFVFSVLGFSMAEQNSEIAEQNENCSAKVLIQLWWTYCMPLQVHTMFESQKQLLKDHLH